MAARAGTSSAASSPSSSSLAATAGPGLPPRGGVRLRALVLIRWAAVAGQLFTAAVSTTGSASRCLYSPSAARSPCRRC
jgi:two-component system sensor histidine kinase RegB